MGGTLRTRHAAETPSLAGARYAGSDLTIAAWRPFAFLLPDIEGSKCGGNVPQAVPVFRHPSLVAPVDRLAVKNAWNPCRQKGVGLVMPRAAVSPRQ